MRATTPYAQYKLGQESGLEDNSTSLKESDSESKTTSTNRGGAPLETPIITNTILDLLQDITDL